MRFKDLELIGVGLIVLVVYLFTDDWLVPLALLVLWLGIRLVSTHDRLFALPMALTFQWSQVTLGVLYLGFTGRAVPAIEQSDYRPMVLIGLGCVMALALGIRVGFMVRKPLDPNQPRPEYAIPFGMLVIVYIASIFIEGSLITIAPNYPTFRQIIVTLDTARLGLLFLVLRRLCGGRHPQWGLFGLVVSIEVVMGITGFFAGFRDPVVLAVLAVLEIFDRKNTRHWIALGVAVAGISVLGLVWMGIRSDYRKEYVEMDQFQNSRSARVNRVEDLTSNFFKNDPSNIWRTADALVDRMWTIYYPALAIARVPSEVPYTDGSILGAALIHIVTPRVFFPNKPMLDSDSDEVRKYANVRVAGREVNTSIAFGYSAEAYIDFGLPWMFLPVFAFGFFIGAMYALFRSLIWHRELFVAFGTVAFWLSVYLFERSWATMLGTTMGFMVYLGPPVVLIDRLLMVRVAGDKGRENIPTLFDAPIFRDHV
jgi:hypothetical protein